MHIHLLSRVPAASRPAAALVAATACWGLGTVVSKQVVDDVEPLSLLAAAGGQLQPSAPGHFGPARLVRLDAADAPAHSARSAQPGIAYVFGLVGLTTITASMSVLLWALEPVVIVLLAALVLREQISAGLAAGLTFALTGVLLVVYHPGTAGDLVGVTLTLVSIGFCALYSVLTRRLLLDDSSLTVVLAQQAAALTFTVTLATGVDLAGGAGWDLGNLGADVWLGAAGSGILYYALGFWLFVTGLRQMPASYAGAYLPLIPVFGLAAGYLVRERLERRQWVGAVVIVTATAASAVRRRKHRLGGARRRDGQDLWAPVTRIENERLSA